MLNTATSKKLIDIPEDWKLFDLGNLGNFSKGSGITKKQLQEDGIPCVRYGEIYTTHDFIIKRFVSFIDEKTAKESKKIKKGDILFAGSGETIEEIGKAVAFVNEEEAYAGGDIVIFSPKEKDLAKYLAYVLETDFLRKQKRRLGQGQSIIHIYKKNLSQLKIPIPKKVQERKKIAEILSTWDTAIEQTKKLKEAKIKRKHSLMQRLLTGKKRLQGFDKDWKEASIRDVFTEIKDTNDGESHNVMTISSRLGLISQKDKFNRVIAGDSLKKYTQLEKEDFAYNKGNSKTYQMGCIYQLEEDESALVPFVYICFRPTDRVHSTFYKHWFLAHGLDRQLKRIITSGARGDGLLNVSKTEFFKLKVPLPEKPEQEKIARIFEVADKEIELLDKQIKALKKQKRGLMQKLLTGKVRVKIESEEN